MHPLWHKLNLKSPTSIYIDDSYGVMRPFKEAIVSTSTVEKATGFYLGFAMTLKEVRQHSKRIKTIKTPDPIIWICYPKSTSKKYTCEFNRDTGWQALGDIGFEGVRQVSIDQDWSALRFRRVKHIKKLSRKVAMTSEGKKRINNGSHSGRHVDS